MVTVEDFSRLVSGIYAAAIEPQRWVSALHDIHQTLGGTVGSLLTAEGATWSFEDSTIPDEARANYQDHYRTVDYVLAAVRTSAVGVVRTGSEIIVPNRNPEFYEGWMRPNHLEDGLFVRLTRGPPSTCFLVASPKSGFDTTERVMVMGALAEHVQHALRAQQRLSVLSNCVVEMSGALNAVRYGVVVVAGDDIVVNLNAAAESMFRNDDGISTPMGRITATGGRCQHELRGAISGALGCDGAAVPTGRALTCARPSGKRPYIVHVLPSHRGADDERHDRPLAVVVIVDPEDEPRPAQAQLRRLFGLTEAEAEVALRVVRGADLKQVSDELSVSLATVRTHLHHVFDKTDTHRQAELVRLLLALCPCRLDGIEVLE